ncbi:MAG TPA: hypothetical protein VFR47_17590 [Anaerolineales bacterium]|nr:hypothetical protein [Anaerolineales bacterium]
MPTSDIKIGWSFWLQWVLASILGFAVGAAMANAVTDLIFTALFGVAGGFTQWLVLRHRILGAGWWVLASTLGFAIAPIVAIAGVMAVSQVMSLDGNPLAAPILLGVLSGVLSAIFPWLILRRQFAQAGWWIPAHLLGSLLGGAMGIVAFHAVSAIGYYDFSWAAAGAMFGAGLGAVTGITLVWLLCQPVQIDLTT